jgi:catechol 2,3-dioxygenase-like lactoylglutathione lyase family enzyme
MSDHIKVPEQLESVIESFDHVSMAVRDIEATAPLITLLGGVYFDGGTSTRGDFIWAQYDLPGWGRLELIAPLDPDPDHFLRRFLAERGEGLHHLTFKVHDINDAVARATDMGFMVTGFDDSLDDWKEAFLHPRSTNGVLIQLAEFPAKNA